MRRTNSNLTVWFSGLALGAVLAFLATIQVVQNPASSQGLSARGPIGIGSIPPDAQVAFDSAGNLVQTDAKGNVVRTLSGAGTAGSPGGTSGAAQDVGGGSGGGASSGGGGGGAACAAGQNGGATDTGVTDTEIKLGATVVGQGVDASAFLGEAPDGMQLVLDEINSQGGICGRKLSLVTKSDGWNPQTGAQRLNDLINGEKVFALAVSPSSEGVNQAHNQGLFTSTGVPLVGADGLNVTQFQDPMIFPVAAATITSIDVMMKDAWQRSGGNLHPAIVFGNTYRFGVEGAFAANAAYKALSGKDIPGYSNPLASGGGGCTGRFCGVSSNDAWASRVSDVNTACSSGPEPPCDFMILLLEPVSALNWMAASGAKTPSDLAYGISGPQPLFTFGFGTGCKEKCDGMLVWTGYQPPLGQAGGVPPAAAAFADALRNRYASDDTYNQFTMGAYVGMKALVAALQQTGAHLTRAGLVDTLNSMAPVDTGLTTTALSWKPLDSASPANRHANRRVQAFRQRFTGGSFNLWEFVGLGPEDPWLGQHTGS